MGRWWVELSMSDFEGIETPESFLCPLTLDLFEDPVILGTTGHTFEKTAIETWLQENNTNPLTGEALNENGRVLASNISLASAIEEYLTRVAGRILKPGNLAIGEQLGAGKDKEVYKGTMNNSPVAILNLRSALLTDGEAAMFVRLGHHPHLVRFFGRTCIETDAVSGRKRVALGTPNALVTEFAPFGNLSMFLGERMEAFEDSDGLIPQLSLLHKLLVAEQIAGGMTAVHAAGIIHRDLAARNVMVFAIDDENVSSTLVKVSDYGISAAEGAGGYLRTGGGTHT